MRSYRPGGLAAVCAVALLAAGCAFHQPPGVTAAQAKPQDDSLETAIAKIRRLSITASAQSAQRAGTVEAQSGELREALDAAAGQPSAASLRRVAEAYRRAGVLDMAYAYFARALKVDSRDGAAYDGRARIWRDWGFPELGLGEAYRATYYAPNSAAAYNTLGTLLHAVGQTSAARRAFEHALALEPGAAYALNNVCYLSFLAADSSSALEACRRALTLDPGFVPTRNNLALAFASAGDLASAASEFAVTGDAAARAFNLGIVLTAAGRFREAERSFQAAAAARPEWTLATERARQTRRLAEDQARPGSAQHQ